MTYYSNEEKMLIRALSPKLYGHIFDEDIEINPITLYEMLSINAFCEGKTGGPVEALRAVMRAIKACDPLRETEEFNDLCLLGSWIYDAPDETIV